MCFASCDQLCQPTPNGVAVSTQSTHFSVLNSKRISFCRSADVAAIYRPSGDQRGEYRFSDPGTVETRFVRKSSMYRDLSLDCSILANRIEFPSGDQVGSPMFVSVGSSR